MMAREQEYDVIVIGGGPAGLSAANTAANCGLNTLLLEQLPRAGELGHPCGGVIAPLPGFITGQRREDRLHFPELDLIIPASMVIGQPSVMRYISPSGLIFEASFPNRNDFPIAAIDKPALLRLMAARAADAGAELRFGTAVTGLLSESGRVLGVRTNHGKIRAKIVLSAEGVSRRFTEEAGLYDDSATAKRYAFIVNEEVEAPAIQSDHVGQINTLGRRYTSASSPVFGGVLIPAPGRAGIYFSVFADSPQVYTEESLWYYLEEYRQKDPRVSFLFTEVKILSRAGMRMVIREAPRHVVGNGFISVGDSVTPGGHLGILPCIFLGQRAARIAAQAIKAGDLSAKGLVDYDRLFHGPLLRGLDTESKIITSLTAMSDEELNRLSQTLSKVNLAPFFFGEWKPIAVETLKWIVTGLPLILRDWRLIKRMLSGKPAG
jgi:flavin-dependent dehydrogenase